MQGRHYSTSRSTRELTSYRLITRGFTLIEILVTLVLISIVLGIALLRIDTNDFDDLLKQEVGRMSRLIELADQQAIYQSQDIGMLLEEGAYSFLQFNLNNENNEDNSDNTNNTDTNKKKDYKWEPVDDALLKPRTLPEAMEIIVSIEGNTIDLRPQRNKPVPQILLSNNGEWTAFEIIFTHRDNRDLTFILNTNENGELEITRESNEAR